jgi:hypothetical protein
VFVALVEVTTEKPTSYKNMYCMFVDLGSDWGDKKYIRNFDEGTYN